MAFQYFSIRVRISKIAPSAVFAQQQRDELFLSPNGRLAGFNQMAMLESQELADQFLEAYMPRLQVRYGADTQAEVCSWTVQGKTCFEEKRSKYDSTIARKRLESGILAANKFPK